MTLQEARDLVKWTPSELARRAGETHSNIRDLENGRNTNPSHAMVMRIVQAFRDGGLPGFKPEDLTFQTPADAERQSA